jgi:AcrR family transcriptional regulator
MKVEKITAPPQTASTAADKPARQPATKSSRKPASAPPPKPYHHGNLRDCLLAAADEVLITHGASGITLREVAKAAGVSHAAPYHHFASLDEMLATVAERGFQRLITALTPTTMVTDTRERLMQISEVYVNCARAQPAQFRLMFGPLLSRKRDFPALQVAAEQSFGMVLAAAHAHDPAGGPALALLGWSLCHGLSNLLIDGALDGMSIPLPPATLLARQLTERALDGGG